MATEKKYKSIGNNEYSEGGKCDGVEWVDDFGNTFRCVFACFTELSPVTERAATSFHTFIKPAGLTEWIWKESKTTTVDNSKYRYETQDARFSKFENEPFDITPETETEPEIKTLKTGLIGSTDFFYKGVFEAGYGAFGLSRMIIQTICELYGLTIDK